MWESAALLSSYECKVTTFGVLTVFHTSKQFEDASITIFHHLNAISQEYETANFWTNRWKFGGCIETVLLLTWVYFSATFYFAIFNIQNLIITGLLWMQRLSVSGGEHARATSTTEAELPAACQKRKGNWWWKKLQNNRSFQQHSSATSGHTFYTKS